MVKILSETRSGTPDDGLNSRRGGFQGAARTGFPSDPTGAEAGIARPGGVSVLFGMPGIGIRASSGTGTARCACPREKARALPRGNCPAHAARLDGSAGRVPGALRKWAPAQRLRRALAAGESRGTGWVFHFPAKGRAAELAALPASTGHWRCRARSIGLRCRCDGERGSSPRRDAWHRSGGRAWQTIRVRALARNGAAGQTRCPKEFQAAAPQAGRQQRGGAVQPGLERKAAAPCGRGSRSSSGWNPGISCRRVALPPCGRRCRPGRQVPPRSCLRLPCLCCC